MVACTCSECGSAFERNRGDINRSISIGRPVFCDRKCSGAHKSRMHFRTPEQKKAEKAAYDRAYRRRDPEALRARKAAYYKAHADRDKEREIRKARMHLHVAYCRRPEYREKKSVYDRRLRVNEYGQFGECYELLLELEKELVKQASSYERRVQKGYYTRAALKLRRKAWEQKKTLNLQPAR